jgi:hypothetical protein
MTEEGNTYGVRRGIVLVRVVVCCVAFPCTSRASKVPRQEIRTGCVVPLVVFEDEGDGSTRIPPSWSRGGLARALN